MINKSNEKEEKYKFRSLTSYKKVEIQPVTLQALEYVISDKSEPTNVAITGNYGAGKSSVIETFELGKKDKKFIHISLAQYDETIKNEEKGLNNRQINTIEGKIINQLLHQIEPNSIRKSIFKTLDAESQIHPWRNTAYLFSLLLLFLYSFNFNTWVNLIKGVSWLSWTTNVTSRLAALAILFVLLLYGIFYLLKLQRDIGFIKHLSLKSDKIETDIEVFSNENSKVSYFDRYLDDVIYLFKQSKADVIVFEDIERFNDSRIFEKIKELNIVINRKRKICGEPKLVFFYLVKDDLFESQERTKFFDFIIPIVPVVTASNSYDKLSEILKDMKIYEELDEKFLFNISLYLDDMRLINNICNEYLTYKEALSTLKLDPEKVFSMIVYKNIFPKDFSLLQKNQGYLYELLHSKDEQLEERKNELSGKIQLLEKEIENAQIEHLRDEVELYGLNFQIPEGRAVIKVNGKIQAEFSSYHEFITELLKEDSEIISFIDLDDAYQDRNEDKENLDSIFPDRNTPEFQERLNNIRNKKLIEKLQKEIKKLNDELGELDSYRLSDVYQYATDIDNFKSDFTEEIRNNPQFSLISFLIRNAYIDESYKDYLTHFYTNTITVEEKEYLRNVVSGRDGNYDISLTNTNEIVNRLAIKDYRYSYVLNYNLFDYLLNSKKENDTECLVQIFKQNDILDFLINFYNTLDKTTSGQGVIYKKETIKLFLKKWLEHNDSLFNEYIEIKTGRYAAPNKNSLILSLMNLVDLSDITDKTKRSIAEYISDNQELLSPNMGYEIPQFTKNLSNIEIKVKDYGENVYESLVDTKKLADYKKIINYIYQEKLYVISEKNLKFFIKWRLGKSYTDYEFNHKNFELLNTNSELEVMLDYCLSSDENILQYARMYIELSNSKMEDHPSYIKKLLLHNILFEEDDGKNTPVFDILCSVPDFSIKFDSEGVEEGEKYKDLYLKNLQYLVSNLVYYKKGQVTPLVVIYYYIHLFHGENDIDEFVDFINGNDKFRLSEADYKFMHKYDKYETIERTKLEFLYSIVFSDKLDFTIYKSILEEIDVKDETFDEVGLSDERMKVMIDLNIIEFNNVNLAFIRKTYPSMIDYFISNNIEEYLNIKDEVHDEAELNDLLKYSELNDSYKLQIIDLLDDFSYIISSDYYDNADESIKNKIRELAKEHWDKLINLDSSEISIHLCNTLLDMDDIAPSERKRLLQDNLLSNIEMEKYQLSLLENNLDLFELEEIMANLRDFDIHIEWEQAFNKLNMNKRGARNAIVNNNDFNQKMAEYLHSKRLISSKSIQQQGIRLNGFKEVQIEYE